MIIASDKKYKEPMALTLRWHLGEFFGGGGITEECSGNVVGKFSGVKCPGNWKGIFWGRGNFSPGNVQGNVSVNFPG